MAHLAALQLQIFQAVLELPETTGNAIRQHIRQSLDATSCGY